MEGATRSDTVWIRCRGFHGRWSASVSRRSFRGAPGALKHAENKLCTHFAYTNAHGWLGGAFRGKRLNREERVEASREDRAAPGQGGNAGDEVLDLQHLYKVSLFYRIKIANTFRNSESIFFLAKAHI